MKYLTIAFISFVSLLNAQSEKEYSDHIQSLIGGEREYSVESGRVDLLTEEYAFEVEWANNWKEAIGQTLWYALQTNRKPAIIIILKSKDEYKYFIQLNSALEYAGLTEKISTFLFPRDFEHLMNKK